MAAQRRILYERGRQKAGFENVAPTQGESRRWERSGRFTKKVTPASSLIMPLEPKLALSHANFASTWMDMIKAWHPILPFSLVLQTLLETDSTERPAA